MFIKKNNLQKANPYQPNLFEEPVTPAVVLDINKGREKRDEGIMKACEHAEAVAPGWNDRCFEMFKEWLKGWPSGYQFLIEDFRYSAHVKGLPEPPSNRSFGGLAVRAKHSGLIISAGTTPVKNPKAHMANANVWRKA